jgi:hypothetical protein
MITKSEEENIMEEAIGAKIARTPCRSNKLAPS